MGSLTPAQIPNHMRESVSEGVWSLAIPQDDSDEDDIFTYLMWGSRNNEEDDKSCQKVSDEE